MSINPVLVLTIFAMMALAVLLTIAVYRSVTNPSSKRNFEDIINRISNNEAESTDSTLVSAKKTKQKWSWNKWWLDAFLASGRKVKDPTLPGRAMIIITIIFAFFGLTVYPGNTFGIYLGILAIALGKILLSFEEGKRKLVLEKQMPLLLSGMRSQMVSGITVQGSILAMAKDLPAPLGEELKIVEVDVTVGVSLEKALEALAIRVPSRLMQFLVASIGIAINSGSDLVPQLTTIEEIVQQRSRIQGKIRAAVALAKPTSYLAMAAPIVMGGWFLISDPTYIRYFMGPGLLMFGVACLMYVVGVFLIQYMVKNVEKI
jgi:Flp pilus assembly protein TadB